MHYYMVVLFENMCVVILSFPQVSLNTLLKKEHELFGIELYVNVIETVGSFT